MKCNGECVSCMCSYTYNQLKKVVKLKDKPILKNIIIMYETIKNEANQDIQNNILNSPNDYFDSLDLNLYKICNSCLKSVKQNKMDKFSIINDLYVGKIPKTNQR